MNTFLYALKVLLYWTLRGVAILLKSKVGAVIVVFYAWIYLLPELLPFLKGPVLPSGERQTLEHVIKNAKKKAAKFNRGLKESRRKEKLRRAQQGHEGTNQHENLRRSEQAIERPNQQHNPTQAQKEALERVILEINS